jgi:hypothetical protein
MPSLALQLLQLAVLSIPVAIIAWTVTHEEVFREPREYCERRVDRARSLWERKFFYLFTCEFCFSHWVAFGFLVITQFKLLYADWRGYLIAFFSLVYLSNILIGIYGRVKLSVKKERAEIKAIESEVKKEERNAA